MSLPSYLQKREERIKQAIRERDAAARREEGGEKNPLAGILKDIQAGKSETRKEPLEEKPAPEAEKPEEMPEVDREKTLQILESLADRIDAAAKIARRWDDFAKKSKKGFGGFLGGQDQSAQKKLTWRFRDLLQSHNTFLRHGKNLLEALPVPKGLRDSIAEMSDDSISDSDFSSGVGAAIETCKKIHQELDRILDKLNRSEENFERNLENFQKFFPAAEGSISNRRESDELLASRKNFSQLKRTFQESWQSFRRSTQNSAGEIRTSIGALIKAFQNPNAGGSGET